MSWLLAVGLAGLCIGCSSEEAGGGEVLILTDATFDAETASGVVLVDFWATWCPPCKRQGPIIDDVARQIGDKAKVCKLDVDDNPKSAEKFNVNSYPTLIVFKDGKAMVRFAGVTQADELVDAIESVR